MKRQVQHVRRVVGAEAFIDLEASTHVRIAMCWSTNAGVMDYL